MKAFLVRRWFLLLLGIVLFGGMIYAEELAAWENEFPRQSVVAIVLFVMSLPLDARSIWQALSRPAAVLLAIGISYGLLPLVALGFGYFLPSDLGLGLMIAASIPCTLASAAVWSRRAGGNDAVALLVMMVTNLTCFVVTPAWLLLAADTSADHIDVSFGEMFVDLAAIVVLPIVLGQLARLHTGIGKWAAVNKIPLGVVAQCGILSMVFLGSIGSGRQLAETGGFAALSWSYWTMMIGSVLAVHLSMLWLGHVLGRGLRVSRPDRIAVGFAGSQKTLMVGLHVAIDLHAPILPIVAYHISQLLADTLIADWLRGRKADESFAQMIHD